MLDNIRVVLVRTFHAGNIGSVARAIKTMGLCNLTLVAPRDFPSAEANKMAAGAEDLLTDVTVVETLEEAICDCTVVIATSARPRGYDLPKLTPSEAAQMLISHSEQKPVALIFGPERMGLHNNDLQHARYRVEIPANPEYNSLNLAAAAQIMSYELYTAQLKDNIEPNVVSRELPTVESMAYLHDHLATVLRRIKFLRPHEGETLARLRHLITRAEPDIIETNILRGILSAIEKNTPPRDETQ